MKRIKNIKDLKAGFYIQLGVSLSGHPTLCIVRLYGKPVKRKNFKQDPVYIDTSKPSPSNLCKLLNNRFVIKGYDIYKHAPVQDDPYNYHYTNDLFVYNSLFTFSSKLLLKAQELIEENDLKSFYEFAYNKYVTQQEWQRLCDGWERDFFNDWGESRYHTYNWDTPRKEIIA